LDRVGQMTLDILFLAKNRLEFTRQSLAALEANTNWDLVRSVCVWDDGSERETADYLKSWFDRMTVKYWRVPKGLVWLIAGHRGVGAPASVMNLFLGDPFWTNESRPELFAKIDNDTILPPCWLDRCTAVMEAHPELDLLGIEPPASRVPKIAGGRRSLAPETDQGTIVGGYHEDGELVNGKYTDKWVPGYAPCQSIGGIGLMRTRAFLENAPLKPHSTYGGFTEWQLQHLDVVKGWIVPPLEVFLLDRLPIEPFVSLSRKYEAAGWQRPWSKYPKDSTLWKWWKSVECKVAV
jgi:hypothetical protein